MRTAFEKMRREVIQDPNQNRPDVPDMVILMTDGIPSNPSEAPENEARRLKNLGVRLFCIGVTDNVSIVNELCSNLAYTLDLNNIVLSVEQRDSIHLTFVIGKFWFAGCL